jgi:aminopeptidase-like protein
MTEWLAQRASVFEQISRLRIGVSQTDNARLFELLGTIYPLDLHRFSSRSEFNGWVVPDAWQVQRAEIWKNGRLRFDGLCHPLAVIGSSTSFSGRIAKAELDGHVFSSKSEPDAFAFHCVNNYRPWAKSWGFCIPLAEYENWEDGSYDIELVTEFSRGEMLVGEAFLQGEIDDTIVFNAHTCHPSQFEDGFSGVALIMELFDRLRARSRRHYSYRMVLAPEHLGTVFYLADMEPRARRKLKCAVFTEMIGLKTPLALQRTFHGDHVLDRLTEEVARATEPDLRVGSFRSILGNDETVWEAPGYEIPCISLSRCSMSPFYYSEYHTSNDTLARSDLSQRAIALGVLVDVIDVLERDATIQRQFDGLIALSNPRYGLYVERPEPTVEKNLSEQQLKLGAVQDHVVRYFDGSHSISQLAAKFDLKFETMYDYIKAFETKGLVQLEPVPGLDWYKSASRVR